MNTDQPQSSPTTCEDVRSKRKNERPAIWTYSEEDFKAIGEHLYYFAPVNASPPPYTTQRLVEAIIDIADDGTLAGVELISGMPPPPSSPTPSPASGEGDDEIDPGYEMDDFIRAVLAGNSPRHDEPFRTVELWILKLRKAALFSTTARGK